MQGENEAQCLRATLRMSMKASRANIFFGGQFRALDEQIFKIFDRMGKD